MSFDFTNSDYINNKYKLFFEKNGYIPEMFNPYNCAEITDIAPTQSCSCGSASSSASVLILEIVEDI